MTRSFLAYEAGAWGLSVGAASLTGRTNGVPYRPLAAADGQICSPPPMNVRYRTLIGARDQRVTMIIRLHEFLQAFSWLFTIALLVATLGALLG